MRKLGTLTAWITGCCHGAKGERGSGRKLGSEGSGNATAPPLLGLHCGQKSLTSSGGAANGYMTSRVVCQVIG